MHTYLKLNEEKLDLLIKVLYKYPYEIEREKVIANELYEKFRCLCLDNYYNLGEGWDDNEEEDLENLSYADQKCKHDDTCPF